MRASGIILPVTALPSPGGIGDLGENAYRFVDFLAKAGQKYWQILPLGRPVSGASPYTADSAFACDPAWISLGELAGCGLLTEAEADCGPGEKADPRRVAHAAVRVAKDRALRLAYDRWKVSGKGTDRCPGPESAAYSDFTASTRNWLADYAMFKALEREYGSGDWTQWPEEIRGRQAGALGRVWQEHADEIGYEAFCQFMFRRQWNVLHAYARDRGIRIIGDIPIYVPLESADVWARPEQFLLGPSGRPAEVAGCPPDAFSKDGQLWGYPLYDWERMCGDGYRWWIERTGNLASLVDVLKIDHFRGFESYYSIPAGSADAKSGMWKPGPGMDLVGRLTGWFPELGMIAEDLGFLTEGVYRMLAESGLPGMKVLQFAFEAGTDSDYLPHKYDRNCVCYTGTHDNDTLSGWLASCPAEDFAYAERYFGLNKAEGYAWGVIRAGMASRADLFMAQMQDYLELGSEARMNEPGTVSDKNWSWRLLPDEIEGPGADALAARICDMARMFGR